MKISKRQLRKLIREEKEKLSEAGGYGGGPGYHRSYALGTYFDVKMSEQFNLLMYKIYENAMEAAREDGHDDQDAYDMVMQGFEELIEEAKDDMRF